MSTRKITLVLKGMTMKLNKKIVALNVLATFLMAESAMARFETIRPQAAQGSSSSSGRSGATSPGRATQIVKQEGQKINAAATVSCIPDQDKAKYFPQEMFQSFTRDEGAGFKITLKKNNKVEMHIPPMLRACGDFVPELNQNTETKSATILMKLIGKKPTVAISKGADGKDVKSVTYSEKPEELTYADFINCIEEKKILVDGKVDLTNVKGSEYAETVYEMDYDFDKKADIKKTATISFGLPKAYSDPRTGFKPLYGYDEKAGALGVDCIEAEKISDEVVYINKGRDVLIEEINIACANQDVARIAELRRSLGNADALSDIAEKLRAEMDVGYLNAAFNKDVKEIEAKLTEIEADINKNVDKMSEQKAKERLEEYATLLKKLDEVYINPAIARLDKVVTSRSKMKDGSPAAKAADEEIKKLNEGIGRVSARSPSSLGNLYFVARKYAVTDSHRTIEDIRLKSQLFSKVNDDEKTKDRLSFEEANKQQETGMAKFEKVLTDATDTYLVGKGNMAPIQKTEKERQIVIDRMNTRMANFQKKELADYNSYCATGMMGSVKNPVKCKEFMSGMSSRQNAELKRREKDLYYIKGRNEKLTKMGESYNTHMRKVAAEEQSKADSYDPSFSGSTFSPYDDTFSERFPMYNGPMSSTAYDPSIYNMGGNSAAMGMMGQQQMYMPQQQMQQGQYQMPQMGQMGGQMMGAWPSM